MKFRPVGAQFFHADGQTDMMKLTVTFPSYVNVPECENTLGKYSTSAIYRFQESL